MSFLAPLFIIGALTVALPVVFHLVRRSSREQLPFSSLLFLQPSPPHVTRRSRLHDILLLLLRCLVICLLALGFARPFWQEPILADQPRETGRKIYIFKNEVAAQGRTCAWVWIGRFRGRSNRRRSNSLREDTWISQFHG